MNMNHISFLTKLLWILFDVAVLLLLFSCKSQSSSNEVGDQKIWSSQILSIEFLKSDTINFFSDSSSKEYSYQLVFEMKQDFKKSKLVDVHSVLDSILTPLNINKEKFLIDFEVKEIDEEWLVVKNYKKDKDERNFFWIRREDINDYSIKNWSDYLIGREGIAPNNGDWTNILKVSPSENARSVPISEIDCIIVNDVVNENWLEVDFDNFCENYDTRYRAFIKWKDSNKNILIKL